MHICYMSFVTVTKKKIFWPKSQYTCSAKVDCKNKQKDLCLNRKFFLVQKLISKIKEKQNLYAMIFEAMNCFCSVLA